MISLEGKLYFPYVLSTEFGPVMGLDPRPPLEIQRDWLARAKRGAERIALQGRAEARSNVANLRLLHSKTEGDPLAGVVATEAGEPVPVTLDEVSPPPARTFDADEVLTLAGLPDGYGFACRLAVEVSGISRAGGADADDFCAGVDTWFAGPRKKAGKKHPKKPKGKKRWTGGDR